MKNKITIFALSFLVFTIGLQSCDTLKDKLFQAFTTNAIEEDFTVKIINSTALKTEAGVIKATLNIDSIIDAETGGTFGLDDISSINIQEVKVTILNPDADNNFANFEEGWMEFNTNANTTPVQLATGLNPDAFSDTWMMPVDNSINLKPYLAGTELSYVLFAKARRVTTKVLNCKIAVKYKIN